jgi:hypothetical protein
LFYALVSLDYRPSVYTPCIAGMTGACHLTKFLLVEMGSLELFWPVVGLELLSSRSPQGLQGSASAPG